MSFPKAEHEANDSNILPIIAGLRTPAMPQGFLLLLLLCCCCYCSCSNYLAQHNWIWIWDFLIVNQAYTGADNSRSVNLSFMRILRVLRSGLWILWASRFSAQPQFWNLGVGGLVRIVRLAFWTCFRCFRKEKWVKWVAAKIKLGCSTGEHWSYLVFMLHQKCPILPG